MRYESYMRRALALARCGAGRVSPNPMVGAVIVVSGRVIGEGYHRQWGGPHAEVNAVRSVVPEDENLLSEATIFVTLEPCSHYGKTPPCAQLLIDRGFRRVVIGCLDPFEKVRGRGVAMLRDAGIEVVTGVLEQECMTLNRRFITAHTLGRPYVQLKWAQSADGFIALPGGEGVKLSTPVTQVLMHRERALADAIMVGTNTANSDNPRLDVRLWPGRNPLKVTFDREGRLNPDLHISRAQDALIIREKESLEDTLHRLYKEYGVTSLMVEGGARLLESFLADGLWDELRIETSPALLGAGVKAPDPEDVHFDECCEEMVDGNRIATYLKRSCGFRNEAQ